MTMKEEQIRELKGLLEKFRNSENEDRELNKTQLLAYLAGTLDGINIEHCVM